MNGQLLSDLCNLDFILESRFRGVFSTNNLPNHVDHYPSAYIVNTADTHSPGEHWISLYFLSFDQCYVFDSLGRDGRLLPPSIHNFILRNCFARTYNSIQIQGANSQSCGLYSVFFLLFICRICILSEFQQLFGSDTYHNDCFVYSLLQTLYTP